MSDLLGVAAGIACLAGARMGRTLETGTDAEGELEQNCSPERPLLGQCGSPGERSNLTVSVRSDADHQTWEWERHFQRFSAFRFNGFKRRCGKVSVRFDQ